jgi:predicted nucleic acid-binding protein
VTLCDTGPLVALIDADDPYHSRCSESAENLPATPMITTWPCLTEAMHLLFRAGGIKAQNGLWQYLADGALQLYLGSPDEWRRIQSLMERYADLPLDLADASLVSAAEALRLNRLFSVDGGMRAVQLSDGTFFEIVP